MTEILLIVSGIIVWAVAFCTGYAFGEYKGFSRAADICQGVSNRWRWNAYRMERLLILNLLKELDLDENRKDDLLMRMDVLNAASEDEGEFCGDGEL